jgi:hypothetical protein
MRLNYLRLCGNNPMVTLPEEGQKINWITQKGGEYVTNCDRWFSGYARWLAARI